jgi:hypothetical protein
MKVVFLDIEGVLVTPDSSEADPHCVAALNQITEATGAHIVLSSIRRFEGLMCMREKLREWGVSAPLMDMTKWPAKTTRDDEIAEWLDTFQREEIQAFVVLDDDDMCRLSRWAVPVNGAMGLSVADAEKAIRILGRK